MHNDIGYGKMWWRTHLLHGVCVDEHQGGHWRRQDEDGVLQRVQRGHKLAGVIKSSQTQITVQVDSEKASKESEKVEVENLVVCLDCPYLTDIKNKVLVCKNFDCGRESWLGLA